MSRGQDLLRRQFEEGPLSPEEDAELQRLLKDSPSLQDSYQSYVELERAMEGQDVPLAQIERMLARGAPSAQPEAQVVPLQRRVPWIASGMVAAAAAFGVFVLQDRDPEFVARGSKAEGRQAWISVFQPQFPGGAVEPVTDRGKASVPFAFAYSNLKNSPFQYLAVVGRDSGGRVHWFYPPYTHPEDTPKSVPIERGVADQELGEFIRVMAAPGPMELCGLFTTEAIDVRAEDLRLEQGGAWTNAGARDCRTIELE